MQKFVYTILVITTFSMLLLQPDKPIIAEEKTSPKMAQIFANNCSSCHLVPDPNYKNDRIWLEQVMLTT